jgi:hypothetical protein
LRPFASPATVKIAKNRTIVILFGSSLRRSVAAPDAYVYIYIYMRYKRSANVYVVLYSCW